MVFRLHPKNYAEKSRKLPRCTSVKECFYFEYLVFQSAVLTRKDTTTNTSLRISRSISGKITFQITSGVLRFISMILNQMSHRHRVNQKIVNETWGPHIKYLGGGEWFFQGPKNVLVIYWWVMKYFRKVLMGNKIFFLFSFLILIFSNFIWKVKTVWVQNVQTGHQGDLWKI